MPISQRAITDAWADLKSDIDANFRGQVENTAIPYPRIALDDPGLCSNLNPPPSIHGPRSFSWSAQGQASLDVQELKVTHFEGVSLQPAVFPDASHVDLPIGFSVAEVSGRYRLECLCIQSSWLGEMGQIGRAHV